MNPQIYGFHFRWRTTKKRRLDKFITKWIKSDLPEDRSSVLLLGVKRIPTSPSPVRRPTSLPLNTPEQKRAAEIRYFSLSSRKPVRRSQKSAKKASCQLNQEILIEDEPHQQMTIMDKSVDSIGTCSLDVEQTADMSELSEPSSTGTLRSVSLKISPADHHHQHLPSYLSLACTVNGYSTTTNYDPIRLSRSRDASPHRRDNDICAGLTSKSYSIQNNLLSPPNLVPLPTHIKTIMSSDHNNRTKNTIRSSETHYNYTSYGKDTTDACYQQKTYTHSSTTINGQSFKEFTTESKSILQESKSVLQENKSFIQQRVERLYGPGALAQGFFVSPKKHTKKSFLGSENDNSIATNGSMVESPMKQSNSSPALPVLRHLRPEFRAQLPIISPKKSESIQKSNTTSALQDDVKASVNGFGKQAKSDECNVNAEATIAEESATEKDGHYFLKILQNETVRLLKLADQAEGELENEQLSEETVGTIRSVAGKARLLVTQKMQQFKGLCTNNITQGDKEVFPTTNQDLQGFWDMVMLQVNQVDDLFAEIDKLKANNWQEVKPNIVKNATNGKVKKTANKAKPITINEEARKKREAERKLLIEERRKAMKAQKKTNSIEIFVPESS